MTRRGAEGNWASWPAVILALVIALGGAWLLIGGVQLIGLGGSWYFAITGLLLLLLAWSTARGRYQALLLYTLILIGTALWAVWEVGFQFWPLVSRLVAPAVLGVLIYLAAPLIDRQQVIGRALPFSLAGLLILGLIATGWRAFQPVPYIAPDEAAAAALPLGEKQAGDWAHYGRSPSGTRYAPITGITPENVAKLDVAWTYRTGDTPPPSTGVGAEDQNTPLQIGDTVYACTVHNIVHALDADTGAKKWVFDPKAEGPLWQRCRSVSHYEARGRISDGLQARVARGELPAPSLPGAATPPPPPADPGQTTAAPAAPAEEASEAANDAPEASEPIPAAGVAAQSCRSRIVLSTIDARLISIDAATGTPCETFGQGGTVDLKSDMGEIKPGFYFQTSAPTVAEGIIIIGGWVVDNVMRGEPSGVVRGYDAETGILVWAWDLGRPETTRLPAAGETYTRGTPNVWSTPAFDPELGLVYLPTGNATPDFFGGGRRGFDDEYNSSVVALNIQTGREVWRFRTVNHDVWDYDVPSQPALYDMPTGEKALIQTTKRGQIFVLDRATGKPIFPVEERPAPQTGAAPEETLAKTQPFSIGMPAINGGTLSEARMWGATPFDQLWCRIEFRKLRYEGELTPPGPTPSLQWPGYYGGMNWGSSSVHEPSGYLVFNDTRSPQRILLVGREEADKADAKASHDGLSSQFGTPYGAAKSVFMSPLGVPCQEPPYGTLTAVDMKTQAIAWQVPLGTVENNGPFNIPMGIAMPVGMPTVGGPATTASGLVFYAGTLDHNIRAFDLKTGKELWKHALPVGSQATPTLYTSPATGRDYVVISAGGARSSNIRGDYVIAFALPKS